MVRLGFIIGFIALIGVLFSGLAAYRVHDQELTVDRIAIARAIDVHASLVQDRLTERELLARVASGLFRAPTVIKADMLQPLRSSIYAFKTDFVVAAWIARLQPGELPAARAELAAAGFPNPTIRGFDDKPLDPERARGADRRADGCRTAQRGDQRVSGPRRSTSIRFSGRCWRPGHGLGQAGGVRSVSAAAPERADRRRAGHAGSAGGRGRARRLRDLFLRAGAADAGQ